MPEGDTLYRTAQTLRRPLEGRRITAATSRQADLDATSLVGHTVACVEARGKHLLIHLEDHRAVHSHLGMTGSWHVYPAEHPWQKPARQAALILESDAAEYVVCFSPKLLELLTETGLRRHTWLSRLGPDILAGQLDLPEIVRRLRIHDPLPLGQAIMNQSIVCGVGNVYKSEVLFLTRNNPFRQVRELTAGQLVEIIEGGRRLMRQNLQGYPRRTRFGRDGVQKWVYGRSGQPCLRCGTPILVRRQGDLGRATYYCPQCQTVPQRTAVMNRRR